MKRKIVFFLLLLALLLCGCGKSSDENIGNEKTVPLDRILESIRTGSTATYESAFPPDFCLTYREAYPELSEIVEKLLLAVKEYNIEFYGEDCKIHYELTETELCDPAQFAGDFQFNHLDSFPCTIPLASEAARIHVKVYRSGPFNETVKEETYVVLLIDGTWYLDPLIFGTTLND